MRVERIRVHAFGRLEGLDTGPEPLSNLIVVSGPNEAGKTTLFHFLATLLYGFAPAAREAHPYAPWSGAEPAGTAHIRLKDGRCWEVHRHLRSAPIGSLVREGVAEELRNRPLPCAEHVPATVFRQVYAVTLSELAGLDGEGWARIQDRLVGALGAPDLRPARTVAGELEQEAAQLWRPNRRGRQAIRERRERLRELAAHRREVAGADHDLRERVRERDRTQAELGAVRAEREAAKLYVERMGALLAVRTSLLRVRALEQEAGPPEQLAALPADPGRRLEELADQAAAQQARLDEVMRDAETVRRKYRGLPRVDARVLERAAEVDRVAARVEAAGWMKARANQLQQELREFEGRIEIEASDLFTVPWERLALDRLRALPVGELRARARIVDEARAKLEARRAAEREIEHRMAEDTAREAGERPPSRARAVLVLVVGLALVFVAQGAERLGLLLAAALAVGAGSVMLLEALRRSPRAPVPPPPTETGPLQAALDEAERALDGMLTGLPLREGLAQRSPTPLAAGLERLQQAIRDRRDREAELAGLREREAANAREVSALALTCGVQAPDDALAAAHLLASTVADMRRRQATAERAAEELSRLERQRDREADALTRMRAAEGALRERLSDLGSGDPAEGMRLFQARAQAAAGAARLRQDLIAAHPDLDELQDRIRAAEAEGEDWTRDDDALARKRAQVQELNERIEVLIARAASLAAEIDQLGGGETLDRVDGEIQVLEEEVRRLERERDRRWVLARLIREADRRFREEHQPELVRRAGEHLATITGGRYARVLLSEGTEQGPFRVRGPDGRLPVDVAEPLSTATREQIWLALRLAAVDHLDRDGERLPLFLDETLVNWDPARRERGIALLARLAAERQLFVFTCHPDVAERLRAQGARVIVLDKPRP